VIDTNDPAQTFDRVLPAGKPIELARQTLILMRETRPEPVRSL
jgi:hypothetical protein